MVNDLAYIARKYFKNDPETLNNVAKILIDEGNETQTPMWHTWEEGRWDDDADEWKDGKWIRHTFQSNQLRKDEREKIFLEDGSVTIGEAHEARRNYLESVLKDKAQKYAELQVYNEKCPEFSVDLKEVGLEKAQRDYEWHMKLNKDNERLNVEQAKERSIKEFITVGRGDFVPCPFHNEKMPSCHIFDKGRKFNCFGCGEKGSVVDWIMKTQNMSFVSAIKYLT